MWKAIYIAREALNKGEVPVGAIVVSAEGSILAAESNRLPDEAECGTEERGQHQRERHRHHVKRLAAPT